jgi:hypothetical protein
VPLKEGQGCIAGPKGNWVGIYWLSATLVYTASVSPLMLLIVPTCLLNTIQFALAVIRSYNSLQSKPLTPWKLMLRDGLNLYGVSFSHKEQEKCTHGLKGYLARKHG